VGLGLFTVDVPRSHSDTPYSVGFLWTNDRPDAETSTWPDNTEHPKETDIHVAGGIRTHNTSKRTAIFNYYLVCRPSYSEHTVNRHLQEYFCCCTLHW